MSKSRLLMLVVIVLLSLVLASSVLAAVRENGAQLAPGSQGVRDKSLAHPGETVALETDLQITTVISPTVVFPRHETSRAAASEGSPGSQSHDSLSRR